MNSELFALVPRLLDNISRTSILRHVCPTIFVKAIKKE